MVDDVAKVQRSLEEQTMKEVEQHLRLQAAKEVQLASRANANEEGGPTGIEPTRYGDWERKGRASDF